MSSASMAAGSLRRQLPAGCRHDRPAGPAAKGLLLRGVPGQQRSCSAPSVLQVPRSPRAAAGTGYGATPSPTPFHTRPDSAADQIRALRMSLQNKPTVSDRSPTPHHIVVPMCRSGGQGAERRHPGACRIRRVTTQGRALRAGGPELDDMNAVTTVGRPSWRA
jgi:hypothetical protein